MELSMTQDDWDQLFQFVHAANMARQAIRNAAESGKQQIALNNASIEMFRTTEEPLEFWLKFGNLLGQEVSRVGSELSRK